MKIKAVLMMAIVVLGSLNLTACSNAQSQVRDKLGLNRESPDEFRVVRRAPLEMPEDFSLPKPTPGQARPQEVAPRERAKAILTGEPVQTGSERSASEKAFLMEAGALNTDRNIRSIVDEETSRRVDENISVIEKLGIREPRAAQRETLDAMSEAERLQQEGIAKRVIKPVLPDLNNENENNNTNPDTELEEHTGDREPEE